MSLPVDRRLQRQPLVPIGNDAVKVDGPYGWTQRVCLNAAGALSSAYKVVRIYAKSPYMNLPEKNHQKMVCISLKNSEKVIILT